MKRILVIEDKYEERVKAEKTLNGLGYNTVVAIDLMEALAYLGVPNPEVEPFSERITKGWDGVVSDLNFPLSVENNRHGAQAYGLEIAQICQERGLPCVICSSIDHHDQLWAKRAIPKLGFALEPDKDWAHAIKLLEEKMNG